MVLAIIYFVYIVSIIFHLYGIFCSDTPIRLGCCCSRCFVYFKIFMFDTACDKTTSFGVINDRLRRFPPTRAAEQAAERVNLSLDIIVLVS
jgi:hypothetical protein